MVTVDPEAMLQGIMITQIHTLSHTNLEHLNVSGGGRESMHTLTEHTQDFCILVSHAQDQNLELWYSTTTFYPTVPLNFNLESEYMD